MIFTDNFIPFFGIVEDVNDPLKIGRIRVRCHGYHSENKSLMPSDQLPWFSSIVSNSASSNGRGISATGYIVGSTVIGFFLDRTYQIGIVMGALPGYVNDVSDLSGLAIQDPSHVMYKLREENKIEGIQTSDPFSKWDELDYINNSEYPKNKVYETENNLIRELDSTPSNERIYEYHPSGTYYEIRPDGTKTVKVVGDGYEIIAGSNFVNVKGECNLTIESDCKTLIKGDWNIQVSGNKKEVVLGEVKEYFGVQSTQVLGLQETNASIIKQDAYIHKVNSNSPEFEEIIVTLDDSYSDLDILLAKIEETGRHQEFDEEETIQLTPESYPLDVPPETYDGSIKEESSIPSGENFTPVLEDCHMVELPIVYNTQLTNNFNIASLTTNAFFPHKIKSQLGLTEQDIVCNLYLLCEHVLEPLKAQFGRFRINSGFRIGNSKSQHNKGQAVDIQEPSWSMKKHLEVAEWIAKNLSFDQLIIEHGNSVWIHVSFDKDKEIQRGSLLTMINGSYENGLKLYYG